MKKNEKLDFAIYVLYELGDPNDKRYLVRSRLEQAIECGVVSPDDPWVSACLGCVNDEDIPDVALEFFIADVKAGYYDLHDIEPVASP